ncbi:Hsp20/alpha crystallin family protein [Calothrix rhizosoleniae]|uniref:Hsp20/alpha crystallin family protein n=1 Tax=Calothrix rhizosoleniae TaxID=888997 RepID=UPI000B4A1CFD|nr:Hsp20/alpha crystallin family protein [Calothrix rhizosoleniae]
MTLVRYNPWKEIDILEHHFNSLLDDFLPREWKDFTRFSEVPAAEISETDDAVYLKLEISGMEAKDLDIEATEDTITISGERKSESKTEEKGFTKSEFYYGKFHRVIPLPVSIQNNNVTAEYKDGILNLTLPKAHGKRQKIVKINL